MGIAALGRMSPPSVAVRALALASTLVAVAWAAGIAGPATPTAGAAQKLVRIATPSSHIDPSTQGLAGPVHPGMPEHPGKLMANVLLPNGYTPKKRYPLLLLFHGAGERFDSWADPVLGDIAKTAKNLNAVIVMPEGGHGFYTNWWNEGGRDNPGWETWVRDELLPQVQRRFSIRPERRYHAVAGFSMGGFGTWLTASMLPGYFGTAVPLSAFASIREPSSVTFFKTASGGTPYETVYGPADGFYAEGHDPVALGSNLAHTRLDVRTGDGQPDPAVRPQNDPAHPDHVDEQDALSLILEGGLKSQNDTAVAAVRAAGSKTIDYTVHKGSHDWEFWRLDLKASIRKGLFRPVPQVPKRWTYRTAATSGQAWDIHFEFSPPSAALATFERVGRKLKVTGSGNVTISDGNGCWYTGDLPFTRTLPARPCRGLKLSVRGKLKRKRASKLTVTVKGLDAARVTSPVDAARVKIAGRSVLTNARGKAVIRVRPARTGKLKLSAKKAGFRPAAKKIRVTR